LEENIRMGSKKLNKEDIEGDSEIILKEIEESIMSVRALLSIYKENTAEVLQSGGYLRAQRAMLVRERLLEQSLTLRDLLLEFLKKERV